MKQPLPLLGCEDFFAFANRDERPVLPIIYFIGDVILLFGCEPTYRVMRGDSKVKVRKLHLFIKTKTADGAAKNVL